MEPWLFTHTLSLSSQKWGKKGAPNLIYMYNLGGSHAYYFLLLP